MRLLISVRVNDMSGILGCGLARNALNPASVTSARRAISSKLGTAADARVWPGETRWQEAHQRSAIRLPGSASAALAGFHGTFARAPAHKPRTRASLEAISLPFDARRGRPVAVTSRSKRGAPPQGRARNPQAIASLNSQKNFSRRQNPYVPWHEVAFAPFPFQPCINDLVWAAAERARPSKS